MKRLFVLLLAMLLLLGGCGAPADTTADSDITDIPNADVSDTDVPTTNAPETDAPETAAPVIREDYTVAVKEDTYVLNLNGDGDQSNKNFGYDTEIHIKNNPGSYTRYGYIKFDISELVGDEGFTAVELDLKLSARQAEPGNPEFAVVEIYGADAAGWKEETLTFNTQPTIYSLVSSRNDIKTLETVYSFPITSYVKYALANGQTEIALYIKEATDFPLHTRFYSKESGENAPKLSIYHGTKSDDSVYGGQLSAETSNYGLDTIVGLRMAEVESIDACEDTYVEGAKLADNNYGNSAVLDFKARGDSIGTLHRMILLKFDISSLELSDFANVYLQLDCVSMQNTSIPTLVKVYGCYPYDWDEMTVTYNTIPETENFVGEFYVSYKGKTSFDVTEFIKRCIKRGDKHVSFFLEGDTATIYRLQFSSSEGEGAAPALILEKEANNFTTILKYEGINPWDYAMENVSDWLHRWEVIKQGGDSDVELIQKVSSEYALTVGATLNPNGASTKYTNYPTRTISSLKGFIANANENAMYDIYGGFMDESMKQEATGYFYTTKIGDRWWTIDPLGYPFYRVACVTIDMGNSTQKAAMLSKYGNENAWAKGTTDRLRELGYNATGGWSNLNKLSGVAQPLAQTKIIYVLSKYCSSNGLNVSTGGNTELLYDTLPVFDPAFVVSAEQTVKKEVSGYENANYIYGWMSDNELPPSLGMLDCALMLDTNDSRFSYSYATAWTFMYLKTGKANVSVVDVTDELRKEYRAMVYDRYFKIVSQFLDKYVPNHQFMGCRFVDGCFKDEYVMRVAGYWCDVISYNYYGAWEGDAELLANQQKWAGKPFIITEWYAKGMDVWEKDNRMTNVTGAGWTVKNQNDRGLFYQNFALQMLECKGCVGFDWFKYLDNDPDDPYADLSNIDANKGIYDNKANEYTTLTKYMDELNNQKYTLIKFFDER